MKTKVIQMIAAIAAVLVAFSFSANAKGEPEASTPIPIPIPVGTFVVTFMNGVVETCEFAEDATVTVTQPERKASGKAVAKAGSIEVTYEDDRVERWSPIDGAYIVNHWHPIPSVLDGPSQMGLAEKKLEGSMEVHEWGTFTVLQGSDGNSIRWYQAPEKIVDLPPFVRQEFKAFGKSGSANLIAGLDSVRMETPVLYFYPEKAMDIRVGATFPKGRITEVFPPSSYNFKNTSQTLWRGSLLPPDSPEKSRVPAATGAKGRHYAAARAVPDAWLFSQLPSANQVATGMQVAAAMREVVGMATANKKAESIEHFIFYRGAGHDASFPIRAVQQQSPGTYQLSNYYRETIPKLFALRVVDGKSSWTNIDQLQRVSSNEEGDVLHQHTLTFPEATGDVKEIAAELRDAMVASLDAEGLTEAEARAMVATWDDLWFTEPGTRVLALLPKSFADDMVPLQISPTPTKLERVFVARLELISREQEQVLASVLDPVSGLDENVASEKLAALQLGRYSAGGMERARVMISAQIAQRFAKLEQIRKEKQALRAASAKVEK